MAPFIIELDTSSQIEEGEQTKFLQIYIYDTENEINNRIRWNSDVNKNILNNYKLCCISTIHLQNASNMLLKYFQTKIKQ